MGDRLASIVRGILKDKFIRAIGERKWTAQDEESINKLSDFFTEFDQRIAALERGGTKKDDGIFTMRDKKNDPPKPIEYYETPKPAPEHTGEHCKIPGCIVCGGPATVERYNVWSFEYEKGHYHRFPAGEVVAERFTNGDLWYVKFTPESKRLVFAESSYRALVEHNTKSGIWERQG